MTPVKISASTERSTGGGFRVSDDNLRLIIWFFIITIIYVVLTGKLRNARSTNQYGKAGTDPVTDMAIGIRQACNPSGMKWLIDMDFTFVNDLMLIADQITDVNKVANAYFNLYNENMFERLEKELTSDEYQKWLTRARSAPASTPTGASNLGGGTGNQAYVGKSVKALATTNILSDTDSSKVVKTAKIGEQIGTYLNSYNFKGKDGSITKYHLITWKTYIFLTNQGFVKASDVQIVV